MKGNNFQTCCLPASNCSTGYAIALVALATVISIATLSIADRSWGASVHPLVPFGSTEFVIVQVLAAIPLALWASSIIHVSSPLRRQQVALIWTCVAVAAAAAAIACGTAIS